MLWHAPDLAQHGRELRPDGGLQPAGRLPAEIAVLIEDPQ